MQVYLQEKFLEVCLHTALVRTPSSHGHTGSLGSCPLSFLKGTLCDVPDSLRGCVAPPEVAVPRESVTSVGTARPVPLAPRSASVGLTRLRIRSRWLSYLGIFRIHAGTYGFTSYTPGVSERRNTKACMCVKCVGGPGPDGYGLSSLLPCSSSGLCQGVWFRGNAAPAGGVQSEGRRPPP